MKITLKEAKKLNKRELIQLNQEGLVEDSIYFQAILTRKRETIPYGVILEDYNRRIKNR